jgi:hypothetical protein
MTSDPSRPDPGASVHPVRFDGLEALAQARDEGGSAPPVVQHAIIDEVARYLEADDFVSTPIPIADEQLSTFHDLLCRLIVRLDPRVVRTHPGRRLKSVWVDILAHGCRPHDWHARVATRTKVDAVAGLQRISYRYVGRHPREVFLIDGTSVSAAYSKTMSHVYYGRTLMRERILWLPTGAVEMRLDDESARVVDGVPSNRAVQRSPSIRGRLRTYRSMPLQQLIQALVRRSRRWVARLATAPLRLIARMPPYRTEFRESWVLMDRIFDARDNGERLFDYLRAERPDINAWFVVEKDTPDWDRMRAAGVSRLVAHGSFRWTMLMLNCTWLLSSHGGRAVAEPPRILRIVAKPTWRYAFLQHGVIQSDLSRWLNQRDIDLFVVSTAAELESVTADDTPYMYTTKETRNTGLPRMDRLLAKAAEVLPQERDLVIVAPTWRKWMTDTPDTLTHRRTVDDAIWDSDYIRNWSAILRSPQIADAATRRGWRVVFMPHPNFQALLPRMELPSHVDAVTFADNDAQEIYARAAVLVTDYSSVAFDVAALDRPVVYYQFDRDRVLGGAHLGRTGYFDYERDGFGPVADDEAGAVRAIVASIDGGPRPAPHYQARIDRTFAQRDGQACARVVAAVEERSRPYPRPSTSTAT